MSRGFYLFTALLYSAGSLASAWMLVAGWLPPALAIGQFLVLGVIALTKWGRWAGSKRERS